MILLFSRIVCASVPARTPRSNVDRLRPLGVLPEGYAGDAEDARFFLEAAGIGDD